MRPDFIYFDLGMVLVTFDHKRAAINLAELAGIPCDAAFQAIYGDNLELDYERGLLTTTEFLDTVCNRIGQPLEPQRLAEAIGGIFQLNYPVFPLVNHFCQLGIPLGILSNTCEIHWRWICDQQWGIFDAFRTHVLSYEERSMKPEPEIYQSAARRAEAAPESILFLDDRAENVEGARRAGWNAVHFIDCPTTWERWDRVVDERRDNPVCGGEKCRRTNQLK